MLQNDQLPLEKWVSEEFVLTWNQFLLRFPLNNLNIRGIFKIQQNISDGMF